jgi:soluble lytic murein transglycosylase-like protein
MRVSLVLVLLTLWLPAPAVAQELPYTAAIYDACARHGCDGDQLVRVAWCESNMDPNAMGNHGEIGLFQIKPWLWPQVDAWNPYDSIEFAAAMFASGQGYYWECQ